MRLTLINLLLTLLPLSLFGQMSEYEVRQMVKTASEQELVVQCSQMTQANYLFHAEIVVDKLLTIKPESCNYNYRKGYLVLASRQDFVVAMRHLQLAIRDTKKNFDMYSAREESAAVDAYYHLAKCYHLDEQIDKAREHYQLFIDESANKSGLVDVAETGLRQCDVAEYNITHPKSAIIQNIGNGVNSEAAEYSPVISLDGNSLYFTSRRAWVDGSSDEFRDPMLNQYPEDIFVSYLDFDGEWTSPEKLAFCQNEFNEATIAVSSDEKQIYVYEDKTGNGDIYYSDFKNNSFDELKELEYTDVNTKFWETHCTMTPDGQTMYFVSERPEGYGGRDIYRIVRLPNGEWSKAQNMGPTINTPYDEDSPYIDINNKTLYFGSNGPRSMGGFDIFVSFKDEEGVWSDPVNMGTPVNSTGDDLFYTTTIDGLRGYLTSFRKGGFGEKDIYEIQNDYLGNYPYSTLQGSFISNNNSVEVTDDMSVKLICPTCELEKNRSSDLRMKNGGYFAVLERCKDYTLEHYDGDGNLLNTESFTTLCNQENEELVKDFRMGDYTIDMAVLNEKDFTPVENAKVEIINPEDGTVIKTYTTDKERFIIKDLLEGKQPGDRVNYEIKVSSHPGFFTQTFVLDTILGKDGTVKLEHLLKEKVVGEELPIALNPIYFDLDKSNIRPDAALELDKIVKIMNDNPEMKVELGSHTDCRASKSYNMRLSGRRAVSSAKYIKSRITNPDRIYGKGYGETKLLNGCECEGSVKSDCSDEEHQLNRRTEFRIVK
ncbi:MAG: OmpA family protein [Crocinitomicaceae bacterium]|nr:OmpA family protein [Crocinitomicaceae bacterium]